MAQAGQQSIRAKQTVTAPVPGRGSKIMDVGSGPESKATNIGCGTMIDMCCSKTGSVVPDRRHTTLVLLLMEHAHVR